MRVFITGGTGSLGRAIIKKFHKKWDITSYSRDELKLSQIEREYPDVNFVIGDVRDYPALAQAMRGADAVIHAAAMKRIEICEECPIEAVKTNVFGTENVIRALLGNGIKKAVVTGSDKGVDPANVYGMTKALQERIFVAHGFNCVRYGNVFGSRGSVAPLFAEQARRKAQLTVTHPDMTRFILTMDDAINLILFALNSPMRGDIFIKKSPAARLMDLANAFSDNIKVVGKHRGEKLHEAIINSEESTRLRKVKGNYVVIGKKAMTAKFNEAHTSDKVALLSDKKIKHLIAKYL